MGYSNLPLKDRLLVKAKWIGDCLIWTGAKHPRGYGMIRRDGKWAKAHRVSYEVHNGNIPDGMVVRHTCDNPSCINPSHLKIGTQYDNVQDMFERGRANKLHGDDHPQAKLTDKQVAEIRRRFVPYDRTHGTRAMAREFGITHVSISAAIRGQTRAHVETEVAGAHDRHSLKVTPDQVREIRKRYTPRGKDDNLYTLGREFNLTPMAISRIVRRKTYKDIA